MQVIVRLCNEGHDSIERYLEDKWYNKLLSHEKLLEMTSAPHFESELHRLVENNSPVLHALLTSNFMTLLAYEHDDNIPRDFRLFVNGQLLPYHDLLMLKNSKILANAKARLPFYYTMPIISWIFALFATKKHHEVSSSKKLAEDPLEALEEEISPSQKKNRAEVLSAKAKSLTAEFIPEGSSLDRELNYLEKQWNKRLSKEAYKIILEDVNSLIRDYTRRVLRTLSESTFTKERIQNLAENLVATPNMQKIGNPKALTEYVSLYMLRLISNR